MTNDLETAKRYVRAIEQGDPLEPFFHPDIIQEEFPNRLLPEGTRRNMADLLEASLRGQQAMSRQSFTIFDSLSEGDRVSMELLWTGTLAIALGSLPIGSEIRAHFAMFLEFRDGRIIAQRNYGCYDPW